MRDPASRRAPALRPSRVGVVLLVERFEACVRFYRDTLGLPQWYEKDHLVCLRFGDGYLMIEPGGVARPERKPADGNPTILRFDVDDVEAAAADLEGLGVAVEIRRFPWGTVGDFVDPDGNRCELKNADDPFFS